MMAQATKQRYYLLPQGYAGVGSYLYLLRRTRNKAGRNETFFIVDAKLRLTAKGLEPVQPECILLPLKDNVLGLTTSWNDICNMIDNMTAAVESEAVEKIHAITNKAKAMKNCNFSITTLTERQRDKFFTGAIATTEALRG